MDTNFRQPVAHYLPRHKMVERVASAIPQDADLNDEADIMRALFAAGVSRVDFEDVLDSAIAKAAADRRRGT